MLYILRGLHVERITVGANSLSDISDNCGGEVGGVCVCVH